MATGKQGKWALPVVTFKTIMENLLLRLNLLGISLLQLDLAEEAEDDVGEVLSPCTEAAVILSWLLLTDPW